MFDSLRNMCRSPPSKPSFQDALRTFFQPIKNDDPRLDFYTMYRREATEYDVDYVKKYDEDLNTTLIFVRYLSALSSPTLPCLLGRSVLRSQLGFRPRCLFQASTRSQRAIGSPPSCDPPHPQPIRNPWRISHRSTCPTEPSERDRRYHQSLVCEPLDLAALRVRRDAGKAMAKQIPEARGWINDRALRRSSAQI